jgi:outer membrane protein assembly factor BamD (BamD/ComL family)
MNDSIRKAKPSRSRTLTQVIAGALLSVAIVAATVIGCSWPGTSHSVRFNGYQTEREMGRLPPLPTMANGMNELRAYWAMEEPWEGDDDPYTRGEKRTKEVDALWDRAAAAENDGNLRLDRDLLKQYLKGTEIARGVWFNPADRQTRRNSAIDRLDALSALDRGSNESQVKAYLMARHAHESEKPAAEEIEAALELIKSDRNLKDNVAYLKAAELYRQAEFAEAAKEFAALSRQYPGSEKCEAAVFMAAVSIMKTSDTYVEASGNSDYKDIAPADSSTDQAWYDAFEAFKRVTTKYPRGKYFNEARGWLAYLMLRRHDRAAALAEYYRLLADKNENARLEAAFSLRLVRSSATDDEMLRVEQELANEPDAALAYAYHNIYNYSIDPGEAYPDYDQEEIKDSNGDIDYEAQRLRDEEQGKQWSKDRAGTGRKELTSALEFSKRLMARYPTLAVGGGFALRAAQASEELEDNNAAASFASRALQSRLGGEERAQALWTLGVAELRRRHFEPARQSFTTLLRDYPGSRLTEGSRRQLAMLAEDAGDIDGALEQYIALDYSIDVAYLVDVLMTTDQLSAFIEKHPDSPKKNDFTYALGLRFLRANRWEDARRTFAQVQSTAIPDASVYSMGSDCYGAATIGCVDPKEGDTNKAGSRIVTPQLVMRDIQTANDLEALERKAGQAVDDEAKAEALYQYASYQYEASTLLFYNPIVWENRYWSLSQLAGEGRYRAADEAQLLFAHMQEHDTPARALNIYLDVVNRFPHTRAARDSLYTAAVCHERLSNYNPYWREIYQNGLHPGNRMVTYLDVKAAYPNYQLPRGTYGWQPATRTVNGGPGWQSPPKPPKPPLRLTKTARLKLIVGWVAEGLQTFWRDNGQRWLTELVILVMLLCAGRVAARNRKRLRVRLARNRIEQSRQVITYPWFEMFWIDHLEPSRSEQLRKFLGEKRQEFRDLARDRRSQAVLIRNIVSHSIVFALLISFIWTVW